MSAEVQQNMMYVDMIDDENVVEPINQILLDSTLWHNLESLITNSGNL